MRVSICIGSACHLKGSREVIKKLQQLVTDNKLDGKVDLNGDLYSVKLETTEEFFEKEILGRLKQ